MSHYFNYTTTRRPRRGTPHEAQLLSPYVGFGAIDKPFDLKAPGAIQEVKRALVALAAYEADPFRSKEDPATELIWKHIDPTSPSWDPMTAMEYALAVGRYAQEYGTGLFDIPPPYAQMSDPGPQPTATGLELLAGAVAQHLGGTPAMPMYLAWRSLGCTVCLAPPSKVSGPKPTDPVLPTDDFGTKFLYPPPAELAKDPEAGAALAKLEAELAGDWKTAMTAKHETERATIAFKYLTDRIGRDALVAMLIARAKVRIGTTTVDPSTIQACLEHGGSWNTVTNGCEARPMTTASAGGSIPVVGIVVAAGATAAVLYWWNKRSARSPGRAAFAR
jgi:hypothetical protein